MTRAEQYAYVVNMYSVASPPIHQNILLVVWGTSDNCLGAREAITTDGFVV